MNFRSDDSPGARARWMHEAISLGRKGMTDDGGGPFGAVVVCHDKIVGRGHNQVTTLLDPTAHAEVLAIREACRSLGRFELRGCELYTSCEPCPMCLAAIYWARLDRVFYACTRHDAAEIGFDDDFIYEQLPLEIAARSLPMEQIERKHSLALFREWVAKPDKISY
ncbi:MAG TPA: nucleoside deaminase [Chthoniobacterales bacterium]|jgi:tRNA(Arg) A34 adenosine deaminase TadA|nr:nucleoside deaminase [Chthoniobacterales bacterium]